MKSKWVVIYEATHSITQNYKRINTKEIEIEKQNNKQNLKKY